MYVRGIAALRAALHGFQTEGCRIRARIVGSRSEHRDRLWDLKRALGRHCRHHALALGVLRGVPYERIEKCASHNRPDAKVVLALVEAHNSWALGVPYVRYDLLAIERYLTAPTLTQEKAV